MVGGVVLGEVMAEMEVEVVRGFFDVADPIRAYIQLKFFREFSSDLPWDYLKVFLIFFSPS